MFSKQRSRKAWSQSQLDRGRKKRRRLLFQQMERRQLMAGDLTWANVVGDDLFQSVVESTVDDSGNVYLAVVNRGTIDFDPHQSRPDDTVSVPSGQQQLSFAKYNSEGGFEWVSSTQTIPAVNSSFVVDRLLADAGGLYIKGIVNGFDGNFDLDADDSSQGHLIPSISASRAGYIGRMDDQTGDFDWAFDAGTNGNSGENGLAVDRNGTAYFAFGTAGSYESISFGGLNFDNPESFINFTVIAQIDVSGEIIHTQRIGSWKEFSINDITIDDSSANPDDWRLLGTGLSVSAVYFGDADELHLESSVGEPSDDYTQKRDDHLLTFALESDGTLAWANVYEAEGRQMGFRVEVAEDGDSFFTGRALPPGLSGNLVGDIVFDDSRADGVIKGSGDFLLRLNPDGSFGNVLHYPDQTGLFDLFEATADGLLLEITTEVPLIVGDSLLDPALGGTRFGLEIADDLHTVTPIYNTDLLWDTLDLALIGESYVASGNVRGAGVMPEGTPYDTPMNTTYNTPSWNLFTTRFDLTNAPTFPPAPLQPIRHTLFEESFESGASSNDWSGSWVEDSQNDWFRSSQRASDGSISAEVDGQANDATLTLNRTIDLTGYVAAELSFDWFIESSFDSGEYIAVDVWDGSAWTEVDRLEGNLHGENIWDRETVSIDAAHMNSDFQIRFRAKVSRSNEDANVDNVSIVGIAVPTPTNAVPTASDDVYTVSEDGVLAVPVDGVLTNDSDDDGDALTAQLVSAPVNGTLALETDGTFEYVPNPDFFGTDSFVYRASDGISQSEVATVAINVSPVNDHPISDDQTVTVKEGTTRSITLTAMDVDSSLLTYSIDQWPDFGILTGVAPNLNYTPNPGYFGPDSFSFIASDGTAASNPATVSIDVVENQVPIAESQAVTLAEDSNRAITLVGYDTDGDSVEFSLFSRPVHGMLSGTAPNLIYTPNTNYNGLDSFVFKVNDGSSDSLFATVAIEVDAVNDAPFAEPQTVATSEDSSVDIVLAGSDIEGDLLEFTVVNGPTRGTLVGNGADRTYVPDPNFAGSDSFTFKVNDGVNDSETVTVDLDVAPVNDSPIAVDDTYATTEGDVLSVPASSILSNDLDVDGDTLAVVPWNGTSAQGGSVALHADGSFTYTPPISFSGVDSFEYVATDGELESAPATVSIEVAPEASNELYVYDIRFESVWGGYFRRAVFEIRSDSNSDGVASSADERVSGVAITVEFAGRTYTGTTDGNGRFYTGWLRRPRSGSYAEVVDLALNDFQWNPLDIDREDDSNGNGLPDARL